MYCRKCRNEINENDVFCPKCGTKVELKEKPYKFKKVFTIIVLSIIVIIAVVGFIFFKKKKNNQDKNINQPTTNNE